MSDDGDVIPSGMQNGGNQYKIKEVSDQLAFVCLISIHTRVPVK